ncbi:MAG: NAD(P)/FAD-dependent oxidoreductase [Planctomycetota bacterium]|nr:MAG: NAD(P)/FAD-dependent oxidoreductase [Planctomycetota bacterium]
MADSSFDVVIVGGGCKGLAMGAYLAKYGGMTVGIFDEANELGGGMHGEQSAPGFHSNPHCFAFMDWYFKVIIKDDLPELWEEGLEIVGRMTHMTSVFPDDSCITTYGFDVDPDGTKTAAEIAKFSEKDAEIMFKWRNIYLERLQPILYEENYCLPPEPGDPGLLMKAMIADPDLPKLGITPQLAMTTALDGLKTMFESEELLITMLRTAQVMGYFSDDPGVALPVLMLAVEGFTHAMFKGGTHNYAHAMHRLLHRLGAKTFTHSEVEKVLIENGKATGIRLKDGSQIKANKAVISTLSPWQLCYDLIGKDHISAKMLSKIDALEVDRICVTWYDWAFTEYPKFKAHDYNPFIDSDEAYNGVTTTTLGEKSFESLIEESNYRRNGKMAPNPLIILATAPNCAELTSDPNHCVAHADAGCVPAYAYPEEWWIKFQHEHAEHQMKILQQYTTNISWDKVAGVIPVTPYYIAKHLKNMGPSGNFNIIDSIISQMGSFRPIPELARHRTPIENLYATGSAWGWGQASLTSAYTCYKVMADDFGLRKPWEEKNRKY